MFQLRKPFVSVYPPACDTIPVVSGKTVAVCVFALVTLLIVNTSFFVYAVPELSTVTLAIAPATYLVDIF